MKPRFEIDPNATQRVARGAVFGAILGDEPPLISDANRSGFNPSHSRWLIGQTALAIVAIGLLAGALSATGDPNATLIATASRIGAGPNHPFVVDKGRGDLDHRTGRSGIDRSTLHIEQLNEIGGLQSYTRMTAPLADIIRAERSADFDHQSDHIGDRPSSDSLSGLPPIILSGDSHPSLPAAARAFADETAGRQSQGIGRALNETIVTESVAARETHQHMVIARPGDTLPKILRALSVREDEQREVLSAVSRHPGRADQTFSGGEIISVIQEPGEALAHVLKVTVSKPGGEVVAVARSDAGQYDPLVDENSDAEHSRDPSLPVVDDPNSMSGETLRDGLVAVAQSNHLDKELVADVMRICGRDFDLDHLVGMKDTGSVLYAPDELGRPELLFVGLTAQGRTRHYYHFRTHDDIADFFDEHGRPIGEHLLNNPTVRGRLGDGFGWRIHPILHERRFHQGVDYAAPYGSPIVAAGAGLVTVIGQKPGYGRYIRIRHDAGHETTYAHIAGVPRGLRIGDPVRQGETIAYVGSTGLSTGPHLYYEVWIDGQRVDPLRARSVGGHLLEGQEAEQFQQFAQRINGLLDVPSDIAVQH